MKQILIISLPLKCHDKLEESINETIIKLEKSEHKISDIKHQTNHIFSVFYECPHIQDTQDICPDVELIRNHIQGENLS